MNGVDSYEEIIITVGERVTATEHAKEFHLTLDKEYIVLGYDGDCIKIENHLGQQEYMSLDYFSEFLDRFD